jgi:hypothetical protein
VRTCQELILSNLEHGANKTQGMLLGKRGDAPLRRLWLFAHRLRCRVFCRLVLKSHKNSAPEWIFQSCRNKHAWNTTAGVLYAFSLRGKNLARINLPL